MQTSAKNVPIFLFACSVPFYFFGLFSLHTDRGVKLVGSLRFWQMGLTGDYDPYQQYFYTRLANFAQAVVVLLIFSLLFMVVFFILAAVRDKIKDLVVAERALFAFALLCFAFYCTAVLIEILFYTNRFHASYILEGKGFSSAMCSFCFAVSSVCGAGAWSLLRTAACARSARAGQGKTDTGDRSAGE